MENYKYEIVIQAVKDNSVLTLTTYEVDDIETRIELKKMKELQMLHPDSYILIDITRFNK